jgi:hypothetical protein
VRAAIEASLRSDHGNDDARMLTMLNADIARYLSREPGAPSAAAPTPPAIPPGAPIGELGASDDCGWVPPR